MGTYVWKMRIVNLLYSYPLNIRSLSVAAHGNFAVKVIVVAVHEVVAYPELYFLRSLVPNSDYILVEEVD